MQGVWLVGKRAVSLYLFVVDIQRHAAPRNKEEVDNKENTCSGWLARITAAYPKNHVGII